MERSEIPINVIEKKIDTGAKVNSFLKKTDFLEFRKSEESFENWFQSLSFNEFTSYMTRLNGIIRETPIKDRRIDGKNVSVSLGEDGISYLPPPPEYKKQLFEEVFNTSKKLTDKEDRALLLYYGIQSIHPYSDGNGRTGRLAYKLFSPRNQDLSAQDLSDLLDHNDPGGSGTGEGRDLFAKEVLAPARAYYLINRELAKNFLGQDFQNEYGKIYTDCCIGHSFISKKEGMSSEEFAKVKKVLSENDVRNYSFSDIVTTKLLIETEKLNNCTHTVNRKTKKDEVVDEDINKNILEIDSELLDQNLTADDLRRAVSLHQEVKIKFIKTLIDVFANSKDHCFNNKGQSFQIKQVLS